MELKKHYTNEPQVSVILFSEILICWTLNFSKNIITLDKWVMLYKSHLEKHNKQLFNSLRIKGELYQRCVEAKNQPIEIYYLLIKQTKK